MGILYYSEKMKIPFVKTDEGRDMDWNGQYAQTINTVKWKKFEWYHTQMKLLKYKRIHICIIIKKIKYPVLKKYKFKNRGQSLVW